MLRIRILGPHYANPISIAENENPPTQLLTQAIKIISEPHESSEMDDAIALMLKRKLHSVANMGEEDSKQAVGTRLIPAVKDLPDQRLAVAINELWDHTIAIPRNPVSCTPLSMHPLSKPKPDLAFGYSEAAFDTDQHNVIRLLSTELGQNNAMPAKFLRFPFLQIEFKAFATDGSRKSSRLCRCHCYEWFAGVEQAYVGGADS